MISTNTTNKNLAMALLALVIGMLAFAAHAQIIVSELKPFKLSRWTIGSGDIVANQNICVALRPRGPYSVTVGGDTHAGEFALLSASDAIEYQLFFNDRPRINGRKQLKPGIALEGLRGQRIKRRQPCNRLTANISIVIPEVNLTAAPSGNYSSNIVLLVTPE